MSFANLGLSDALVRAVADAGYTRPTAIQSQAIPVVLSGADLLAAAQTGTGKTAAFVLPILQRLGAAPAASASRSGAPKPVRKVRGLILAPTRELAAQIEESVRTYGKYSNLSSCVLFGGVSIKPQVDQLRRGTDLLVATPGRLLDHCGQGTLDLSGVQILVLDEADRMLDMGFLPDIRRILAKLPKQRQNLLFSATFGEPIRALAHSLLHAPQHIEVARRNSTVQSVVQTVHPVDASRKAELLVHLIQQGNWYQVLVFARTKHGANRLAVQLEKNHIGALAIHGNKSQNARTRALAEFKSGKLQVLVATDIAARGLDIDQLPHVVNFELPHVPEDYVHRIGRTGRAGAVGEAVSLVSAEESGRLRDIERLIQHPIARVAVPGFEPGQQRGAQAAQHPRNDVWQGRSPSGRPPAPRANTERTRAARGHTLHGAGTQGARGHATKATATSAGARPRVVSAGAVQGLHAKDHRGARSGGASLERSDKHSNRTLGADNSRRAHNSRARAGSSSPVAAKLPPGRTAPGPLRRDR
jgi:ATP-dependent RNA helicase RhlE